MKTRSTGALFIHEQFQRHMDRTVADARADHEASAANYLASTGLEAARSRFPGLGGETP